MQKVKLRVSQSKSGQSENKPAPKQNYSKIHAACSESLQNTKLNKPLANNMP
jgi:hypothetical protein